MGWAVITGLIVIVYFLLKERTALKRQLAEKNLSETKLRFIEESTGIAVDYGEFAILILTLAKADGTVGRYMDSDIKNALKPLREG